MELRQELANIRDQLAKLTAQQWVAPQPTNPGGARVRCIYSDGGYQCDNQTRNPFSHCADHETLAPHRQEEMPRNIVNLIGATIFCIAGCGDKTRSQLGLCQKCRNLPPSKDDLKFTTIALAIFATIATDDIKTNIAGDMGELLRDIIPDFNYGLFMQIATKGII